MREFATAAGYKHASGVQRYVEPGYTKPLPSDIAAKFVQAFAGKGTPPIEPAEIFALTGVPVPANATPAPPMEGAGEERMRRDVPVWGTALGADEVIEGEAVEQTYLNTGEVVKYVRRPVLLNGRADIYALYVQGSSMAPRHRDGALVFVEQKRKPSGGEDAVIYLRTPDEHDGERPSAVLIKTVVRKTASYIELEQYTPHFTFRIPMDRVAEMHRVVPWDELVD